MENKFIQEIFDRYNHLIQFASVLQRRKIDEYIINTVYRAAAYYAKDLLEFPESEIRATLESHLESWGDVKNGVSSVIESIKDLNNYYNKKDNA